MADVVIIGGGPAGSVIGSYLSKAGIDNVLFEKAIHPRPHVGESLVSSTTRIFDEIGFLEVMEREGFVKKYGAAWHPTSKSGEFSIKFAEFPQPGIHQDHTYHVDRARFDMLLLKHASLLGTRVHQGSAVRNVVFEGNRAVGVNVDVEGNEVFVPAKIVVDASGRQTVLGSQQGLKKKDALFNQYAVHAWFEGLDRGTSDSADDIHIYFLPVERGWVWQIPISESITSVGVVVEKEQFKAGKGQLEDYFQQHVEMSPDLTKAMAGATRINDFKQEGDYSYSMKSFIGDGFLLVGDAARFVDPIFSSGVSVAAYSAKFASEAIEKALADGDTSRQALVGYEARLRQGVEIWYEFIRLYYKLMNLFTLFIQSKDHRLEILQLLQGEVFDRKDAPVLDAMRAKIRAIESTDGHLLASHLTSVPID